MVHQQPHMPLKYILLTIEHHSSLFLFYNLFIKKATEEITNILVVMDAVLIIICAGCTIYKLNSTHVAHVNTLAVA